MVPFLYKAIISAVFTLICLILIIVLWHPKTETVKEIRNVFLFVNIWALIFSIIAVKYSWKS